MATQSNQKPVVLITGASGLIGSHLIASLSDNYCCVGLDVKPLSPGLNAFWSKCDLTDDRSTAQAVKTVQQKYGDQITSVVHLAAYYDFSGEPSPLYDELTVAGTARLLKHLQSLHVEQFIFSSSLLVMKAAGDNRTIIKEGSPVEPEWDYPESKLKAELVVLNDMRRIIPSVILRIAGVYDDRCRSIPIAQQIKRIYEKDFESYFFPGNAEHGQAFVHLDDLVDCIDKTIARRASCGKRDLFLIAEPEVMSYRELQDEIGTLIHGKDWPTLRIPKTVAKAGAWVKEKIAGEGDTFIKPWMVDLADGHYPVSIDHARTTLSWEPQHRLRTTLPNMIEFLKDDPRGWYKENKLPLPESLKNDSERETPRERHVDNNE